MDTRDGQATSQEQATVPQHGQADESDLERESARKAKQQQWDHLKRQYERVTDALGKRIDPGILETVVVLNALHMHTTASCEGHLDWGTGAPWIDIAAPGVEEEDRNASEATARAREQRQLKMLPEAEIAQLFVTARALRRAVNLKHLQVRKTLMQYLTLFYQDRQISYDRRLIVYGLVGEARLESQGAGLLPLLTQEERQHKLDEYQGEMMLFTHFLKKQFFYSPKTE
jgi:hypothetical protein